MRFGILMRSLDQMNTTPRVKGGYRNAGRAHSTAAMEEKNGIEDQTLICRPSSRLSQSSSRLSQLLSPRLSQLSPRLR